jgi:RNA-directed DNA polymerase
MTKLPYPLGWIAGSKVRGIAPSPGDYAWNVNFNNGNSNWNNQNNEGFVRAVRAGECQEHVSLKSLHTAWRQARRAKKPSRNQLEFDSFWLDGLLTLQERLDAGTWKPGPSTCFISLKPKAREIHAPDFADRIVHHWLVPQLEAIYEPIFIFDAYSNRKGKGTHAAVERLKDFVHQVESGQGGGWYLQLDIRNFFNSIHRPTLYAKLKDRMTRHGLGLSVRRAVHALLKRSSASGEIEWACTPAERAAVPAHKRLENAAPGCGIAIGNLSSQFFANVYLDALDQFVKHELKAQRYVRYVDDFILVHRSRTQLVAWQAAIEKFLRDKLRLELKPGSRLQQLACGIDFLGYIVYPRHVAVRRRVIDHAREKLDAWAAVHVRRQRVIASPVQLRELRSICASYAGHFSHANTFRLRKNFRRRYPWLGVALQRRHFDYRSDHFQRRLKRGPA